jgi:hypothetical protein
MKLPTFYETVIAIGGASKKPLSFGIQLVTSNNKYITQRQFLRQTLTFP